MRLSQAGSSWQVGQSDILHRTMTDTQSVLYRHNAIRNNLAPSSEGCKDRARPQKDGQGLTRIPVQVTRIPVQAKGTEGPAANGGPDEERAIWSPPLLFLIVVYQRRLVPRARTMSELRRLALVPIRADQILRFSWPRWLSIAATVRHPSHRHGYCGFRKARFTRATTMIEKEGFR